MKCRLEKNCTSHILLSSAGHSATFPRTEGLLKGTWKFSIISRDCFVLSSRCSCFIHKHCVLSFLVLRANDSFSFFNLSRISPNLYCRIQALVYLESGSAPWRWAGSGKAYSLSQRKSRKEVEGLLLWLWMGEKGEGGMGIVGEKQPVEITEDSSDQDKNKAESNPWVLPFLYTRFLKSKIRVLHLLIA